MSAAERAEALAIRLEVFVGEQGVDRADEIDGLDDGAWHLLAEVEGAPIGTLRLRLLDEGTLAKIERVAVRAAARGSGAGLDLVAAAQSLARRLGATRAILHAQVAARRFYEKLGYEASGPSFMEDGIRHIRMSRPLP